MTNEYKVTSSDIAKIIKNCRSNDAFDQHKFIKEVEEITFGKMNFVGLAQIKQLSFRDNIKKYVSTLDEMHKNGKLLFKEEESTINKLIDYTAICILVVTGMIMFFPTADIQKDDEKCATMLLLASSAARIFYKFSQKTADEMSVDIACKVQQIQAENECDIIRNMYNGNGQAISPKTADIAHNDQQTQTENKYHILVNDQVPVAQDRGR